MQLLIVHVNWFTRVSPVFLKCVCACIVSKAQYALSTPADLLFPMELIKVLIGLEPVVGEWYMLGLHLGLSDSVVDTIE